MADLTIDEPNLQMIFRALKAQRQEDYWTLSHALNDYTTLNPQYL